VKYCFLFLNTTLLIIFFNFSGFSQESEKFNVLEDNIESMLPPLGTIIDSALANNPSVRFRDLQIIVNKYKLSTERNQWTRSIGLQTDVRYGTFNNFSTNTSEGQSPSTFATLSSQLNYGVGAYIKLPLFDFFNRKNLVEMATTEVQQAESFAQTQRNELRQIVIRQYNDLVVKHRLLKIKSKHAETSKINMQMVEHEFTNGIISISEYSRISEIVTRTEIDFENSRMEFLTAYMILEEITGIRFNLIR